ncbi:hypothetical protein [Geotalea toluenoxydans]|uniref:hypothetical protein n=1 Tax=Geotalea toluenoxydans TaxID=421624 RepID=UPI0006D0AAE5|nr:hypothetical protein [Geotalea toluenoxydans]
MFKKAILKSLLVICCSAALISCGDSKGGGTAEFNTVYATANGPTSSLDADVAKWVDAKGTAATACIAGSSPSISPDVIEVAISTVAYSGVTNPSKLYINGYRMVFTPADSLTPALPPLFQTQYQPVGQTINAGTAATVSVRVATHEIKDYLQPVLNCNGTIYNYDVTISFDAVELDTNRSGSVDTTKMRVRFADFADKSN